MKRKLLCIIFMVVGAASIAGTILLSRGRSEYADASPVFTLIILSIITIVAAAFNINVPDEPEISGREKVYLWAIRITGILSILVCFAFVIIMFFLTRIYNNWLHGTTSLMVVAVVGFSGALLSLQVRPYIYGRDIAKAVVALVIAASLGFIYMNYMPKYRIKDGVNTFRSDTEFAQKDVFYPTLHIPGEYDGLVFNDPPYYFGGNPFTELLYEYYCDSYTYDAGGLRDVKAYIIFNPATGAYKYSRAEDQDQTYDPGRWPDFNWNFMSDKDGKHDAVLNLYFREWYPDSNATSDGFNPMLSVSSGEWDVKLKEVMYPHNFPEDEARTFLRSIGEGPLKQKLLEKIKDLDQVAVFETDGLAIVGTKGKTVEVFFFGIDIATYQNGQITLTQ